MHDRFELWILSSCVGNISYMTSVRPVELHNVIGLEWSLRRFFIHQANSAINCCRETCR